MNMTNSLREFRPALRFVGFFVGIYLAGNVLYGLCIEWYRPRADPLTVLATKQSVTIMDYLSGPVSCKPLETEPIVLVSTSEHLVLRVYEGCNGMNVMIVFIAFVVAFGGEKKRLLIFSLVGLVIIHLANLARINLLFYTALYQPDYFYYFHKYFFTACLYIIVFLLWYLWVARWSNKKQLHAST